jgi:hypothetical protein
LERLDIFIKSFAGTLVQRITVLVAAISISTSAFTQSLNTPSIANETWFDNIIGVENSGVINGPEYKVKLQGARTNPFFGTGEASGIATYNNNTYAIPLIYDIYTDELVVKHMSTSGRAWFIQLEKSLVTEFVLPGHTFRNFGGERGFHEVIYDGDNLQVLAKRTKRYEVKKGIFNYVQADRLFIKMGEMWKTFAGTSGFNKVLDNKAHRKHLKDFLNQNKIGGRLTNAELAQVGRFVDDLLTKPGQ